MHYKAIRQNAEIAYPGECCGALVGRVSGETKTVYEVQALSNEHEEGPERRFRVSPAELFHLGKRVRAQGDEIVGFYHSHPDSPARPSEYDRQHAWNSYSYVIVAVDRGAAGHLCSWLLNDDTSDFELESVCIEPERSPDTND